MLYFHNTVVPVYTYNAKLLQYKVSLFSFSYIFSYLIDTQGTISRIWVILLWRSCIKRKVSTINDRGAWTFLVQPSRVPSFQKSLFARAKG